jgi:hypothetical protein
MKLSSFFEHKISMKMLLMLLGLFLICSHFTVRSCCQNHGLLEGLQQMATTATTTTTTNLPKKKSTTTSSMIPAPVTPPSSVQSSAKKEGFVGGNTNYGESSSYSLAKANAVDTSKWGLPSLSLNSKAGQAINNRPNQSLPLPDGQLSIFDNMPFSPECCPNAFSSSMGCACMNTKTYNYLNSRAGNNVPYSEY